jgi:hypothetical protein
VNDEEAHEFYADPEHLRAAGRGRRRKADYLTEVTSVRFSARMLAQAEAAADAEGRGLGSWIRKAVSFELIRLARAQRPEGLIPDSGRRGEPKALPSAIRSVTASIGCSDARTFSCQHMTVGNAAAVSCGVCGPLRAVA